MFYRREVMSKPIIRKYGEGVSIYDSSLVYGEVTIGDHTWVGPFTILDGSSSLCIGSYCSICAGVQIYTHNSVKWALSGGKEDYSHASVVIGDRCYIGPHAVICQGVTIPDGSIIPAHSIIKKSDDNV